jgi:hypothetical protein
MTTPTTHEPNETADAGINRTIMIDARHIHRCIAVIIGLLIMAAVWALVAVYPLDLGGTAVGDVSVRLFDLDEERGFPAAFSFTLLLAAGGAAFLTTWAVGAEPSIAQYSGRWRLLALALAFVAFDEAFIIHEWINGYLRATFDLTGFLYYAWVIPYGIGALVIAALMVAPLSTLPKRTAGLLVVGGMLYVLGAAGAEVFGGQLKSSGAPMYLYEAEIFVEELLEWAGLWVFIGGMLELLGGTTFHFGVRAVNQPR